MFLFLVGVLLSVLFYYKLVKPCCYWKEKGVVYKAAWPLIGSLGDAMFQKKPLLNIALDLYNKYPNERYVGYMQLTRQVLLLRDVELIKLIGVKDFGHFTDHNPFVESESSPLLSKSLIVLNGQKWRDMRSTISPAFTSSKMKNMYGLIEESTKIFISHFETEVELDIKDTFSKFASNVIASTAFGIQTDSLNEDDQQFYKMGVSLTQFTKWQMFKAAMTQISKGCTDLLGIEIFPKHVTEFFRSIITDHIKRREAEGIVRPDLIHLLLEARKGKLKSENTNEEKKEGFATVEEIRADSSSQHIDLTDEHIVAQAMLFFFAGFETVSTASSFMAHELAANPDIQKKLQEEIDGVRNKYTNKMPYEVLLSMKYLDQVLSETLRLWPPVFEANRLCVNDYLIRPTKPEEKPFLIEKGISVGIPTMALHRDPQYYPEPNRFNPDRFSDDNKSKIISGTYLPFGIGPRNCVGSRFAILEIKTLFYYLLSKFDIVPVARTQIPIVITKKKFNMQPENGFWLGIKPRK